jgi:hypothetical protein
MGISSDNLVRLYKQEPADSEGGGWKEDATDL